ncbi:transmembrane protein 53 [Leptopilina heterotoma]|uniref:transmembrane protein 53 n=1 Tax=Leptopilina heterotoma TaxID=63436 RepID=UPI001CA88FEB|nr:transmembrane protein 53 [Leptopilina heterotoma]XP_043482355.1 transmembrane protein 53 [Leptopilina heterotoma]XP_043482356.1 transmembrane protein 53 [Leptopilina heterotoma]XP_043482357.1 transmembrane protein 53 [Leptopilina heterotoma]
MALTRMALSRLSTNRLSQYTVAISKHQQNTMLRLMACRFVSTHRITKNIELITQETPIQTDKFNSQGSIVSEDRPLLVLLCWLLAQRKHVMKYAAFYMEQGFDVVTVTVSPWQLMWPANGTRKVAAELLEFMDQNKNYQQIMLHGFSIGGYMWGEVCDYIHKDRKRYNHIIEKIVGQVWDSAVDITEITIGVPPAVFPNNVVLQNMFKKYMEYHLTAFHKQATQYYIRSSQLFHTNIVHSPALFLLSKTDTIGAVSSNMRVRDSWESLGTKTYVKIFENSPHVGHFRKYPKEYIAELYAFMNMLQMIQDEEKVKTRL